MTSPVARRVVLVGAGHAHVRVLESWAKDRPERATLTLVVDHDRAVYSGMVPGLVAGDYTGAAPPDLVRDSDLPRDAKGFVRVKATLEVPGCDGLLACGDCATIVGDEWIPKAGVYAVRQGPVVNANLRALLSGSTLQPFEPQRHFLSLLNLGRRRALATKWGLVLAGRTAWLLKDRIDRAFVRRYSA